MTEAKKGKNFLFELFNKDRNAVILLVFLIILYGLPALLALDKLFFDDNSLCYERLFATARAVQNGEIPLWDSLSFTGSRPFFVMVESPIYNVLLYPFFLMADLNKINGSFFILYVIPYFMMLIIAALGVYYFTRKILKFQITASFVSGFLYAVSPVLGASLKSVSNTQVFVLIPWVLLFAFYYMQTDKIRHWLLTILMLVLLSVSVTLNYLIRSYFLMGLIIFASGLFLLIKKKVNIFTFINSLTCFGIAMGLLSFIWTGMLDGVGWIKGGNSMDFASLVSEPHYSMFPGYVMNVFMQDFHGLVTCYHGWGNAVKYDNNVLLSGGFLSTFFIFIALFVFYKKSVNFSYLNKVLFWVFFSVFAGAMLTMMGKHTPVYFILCALVPPVFKFPYAFYFLFYQGFTYSVLVGFGINFVFDPAVREELKKNKMLLIYTGVTALMIFLSLIEPVYSDETRKLSFESLISLKEVNWLLTNRILLLAFFILTAFLVFANLKKSFYLLTVVIIVILVESFFYGYITIYRNTMSARIQDNQHVYQIIFQSHWKKPLDHPILKETEELKDFLKDKDVRFLGTVSSIDNIAWLINKRSTFGYDSKPVVPEMYQIIKKVSENYPYELYLRNYAVNLFKNLNIGYLLTFQYYTKNLYINKKESSLVMNVEPQYDAGEIHDEEHVMSNEPKERGDAELTELKPINLAKRKYRNNFNLVAYEIEDPIPYFYFHDKVQALNEKDQMDKIVYTDLKERIYLTEKDAMDNLSGILKFEYENGTVNVDDKTELTPEDQVKYFKSLQDENKIIKVDNKKTNSITVETEIKKPAVLVRNEAYHKGWTVYVKDLSAGNNSKSVKLNLMKVNYLQQGVVLKPGKYLIEYKFFPDMLKKGLMISFLITVIFLIYLAVQILVLKKKL